VSKPTRALLCYSHDSEDHRARVLALAQRLRNDGVDAWLDQFEPAPPQGWPRWLREQVERADFIILVCTPAYRRSFEGSRNAETQRQASWEGLLVEQLHYEGRFDLETLIPVLFDGADLLDIPTSLRAGTHHQLDDDYEGLRRRLLGQLLVTPMSLGEPDLQSGMPAQPDDDQFESGSADLRVRARMFEGPGGVPATRVPNFTGRACALDLLERLLTGEDAAVCMVAEGMAGIGKTAVVQQFVATRARDVFPDGVAWLSATASEARELARVCRRFGWSWERDPSASEAVQHLAIELAERRVLLVVDDVPQGHDGASIPIPGVNCRTLVTTRDRTLADRLDAASLELELWSVDECRTYLRKKVGRARDIPDAELDALARFVGQLPLGLVLVASLLSRKRSLTAGEILQRLERQPLTELSRTIRGREQGVAAAFREAYDDLDDLTRRTLHALAACAKQTRTEIIGSLLGVDDIRDRLDDLLMRSLADFASVAEPRWDLHDLLRLFVCAQPDHEVALRAHEAWVDRHLDRDWKPTEHQDFELGLGEARHDFWRSLDENLTRAFTIYVSLSSFLLFVGRYPEAIELGQALRQRLPPESEDVLWVCEGLAVCYVGIAEHARAIELFERALPIHEASGAVDRLALTLTNLGGCYGKLGDHWRAIPLFERALAVSETAGYQEGQANALGNLGASYVQLGMLHEAVENHRRSLAINLELGRVRSQAICLDHLGDCYHALGDYQEAIGYHQTSLSLYEQLGVLDGQGSALANLGADHRALGELDQAIHLYRRALEVGRETGDRTAQANQLGNLGVCLLVKGDVEEAVSAFEAAFAIDVEIGRTTSQAITLGNLAVCWRQRGELARALEYGTHAFALDEELGNYEGQVRSLMNLAETHWQLGNFDEAVASLGTGLKLSESYGDWPTYAVLLRELSRFAVELENAEMARIYLRSYFDLIEQHHPIQSQEEDAKLRRILEELPETLE
jgi:tetratricopeptide (TPR) repeat protein